MHLNCAGLTDVGQVRRDNEDHWLIDVKSGLLLVADGMGGARAGGLASKAVVQILPRLLARKLQGVGKLDHPDVSVRVQAALAELSEQLRTETERQLGKGAAGSTVVLALVRPWQALVAHMGDSRAYLLHEGRLQRLTEDHTLAQLLVNCGEIQPEDVPSHPSRSQLTRFVGMSPLPPCDIRLTNLAPGDRLLLCTDGLTGMLTDQQLLAVLAERPTPDDACRQLVSAANAAGGADNVTAVVAEFSKRAT